MNVAALNHALGNIPAEQLRMHLCWGNYPGPHTIATSPLADIADIVWSAKAAARCCSKAPTRATRTSLRCFEKATRCPRARC